MEPNLHILVKDEEVISEPESRQIEVPEVEETSVVEANAYQPANKNTIQQSENDVDQDNHQIRRE